GSVDIDDAVLANAEMRRQNAARRDTGAFADRYVMADIGARVLEAPGQQVRQFKLLNPFNESAPDRITAGRRYIMKRAATARSDFAQGVETAQHFHAAELSARSIVVKESKQPERTVQRSNFTDIRGQLTAMASGPYNHDVQNLI